MDVTKVILNLPFSMRKCDSCVHDVSWHIAFSSRHTEPDSLMSCEFGACLCPSYREPLEALIWKERNL